MSWKQDYRTEKLSKINCNFGLCSLLWKAGDSLERPRKLEKIRKPLEFIMVAGTINTYLNSELNTKFLSPDIQNEMLKIISQIILQKLIASTKTESRILPDLYAVPANIYNQEQVSICIRYCTNTLQSDEIFLGFYKTCKTN